MNNQSHELRRENLDKLKNYETLNVSFDVLSRAAFLINASRDKQPIIELNSSNGIITCEYDKFILELNSSKSIIFDNNGTIQEYDSDDKSILEYIKQLL